MMSKRRTIKDRSKGGQSNPERRSFLEMFLGGIAVAFSGTIVYPVWKYLQPPASGDVAPSSVKAGLVDDLKTNSGVIFRFGHKPGIVIRTPAGEVRAFSAVCTHLDCTVQYRPDLEHIWCACHNGHYDLNGINIGGPPPRPLEEYAVNIANGQMFVSKRKEG